MGAAEERGELAGDGAERVHTLPGVLLVVQTKSQSLHLLDERAEETTARIS